MRKFGQIIVLVGIYLGTFTEVHAVTVLIPYRPNMNHEDSQCNSWSMHSLGYITNFTFNLGKVIDRGISSDACYDEPANFKYVEYSAEWCKKVLSCSAVLLNEADKRTLRQITAEKEAKERLAEIAPKMEKLEKVKLFAEEIGMADTAKMCPNRYALSSQKNAGRCNKIFTKVFREMYPPNVPGRGNNEFNDFTEETSGSKRNSFTQYFQNRFTYSINLFKNSQDQLNIKKYAEILTQKLPAGEKRAIFFDELFKLESNLLNDPIISFKKASPEFEEVHGDFVDSLLKNENLDEEQFKTAFLDYRKKRAKEILEDPVTCNPSETYEKLCNDVINILDGNKIPKNTDQMVRKLKQDADPNRYVTPDDKKYLDTLKDLIGRKLSTSDQMARLVDQAGKCQAYVVSPEAERTDIDIDYTIKPIETARMIDANGKAIPNEDRVTKYRKAKKAAEDLVAAGGDESLTSGSGGNKTEDSTQSPTTPERTIDTPVVTSRSSGVLPIMPPATTVPAVAETQLPDSSSENDSSSQDGSKGANSNGKVVSPETNADNNYNKELAAQVQKLQERIKQADENIKNLTADKKAAESKPIANIQELNERFIINQKLEKAQRQLAEARSEMEKMRVPSERAARNVASNNYVQRDYSDLWKPSPSAYSSSASSYGNTQNSDKQGSDVKAYREALLNTSSTGMSTKTKENVVIQPEILDTINMTIQEGQQQPFMITNGNETLIITPTIVDKKYVLDENGNPIFTTEIKKLEKSAGRAELYNDVTNRIKYSDLIVPVQEAIDKPLLNRAP
jgi:hypothetical protein